MINRKIRVGSRDSVLAVIQSRILIDTVHAAHPEIEFELITMKTTGDKILDRPLDKIGGKGLFVKELDKALIDKRIDLSVHSLKDMPMELTAGLPIVGYSKRANPRDALILRAGTTELDHNLPIGCSSLRRQLMLQKLYPDMQFESVRGNVQTRLSKLDSGKYCALVLACAGLERLGLEGRISREFTTEESIPAAGQGILAVQGRGGEEHDFLDCFCDRETEYCALAERAFVRTLNGSCTSPIAAYSTTHDGRIFLTGLYYDEQTGRHAIGTKEGACANAEEIGCALAHYLEAAE